MKAILEMYGPPHQYKYIEVISLPIAGGQISLQSSDQGSFSFHIHNVNTSTQPPTISVTINENNWTPSELSEQFGTSLRI